MNLILFAKAEIDLGSLSPFGLYTIPTGAIFRIQDSAVCLCCLIQLGQPLSSLITALAVLFMCILISKLRFF